MLNRKTSLVTDPRFRIGDIHAHLAIAGERIFTAALARKGHQINPFSMSLMEQKNRPCFRADESAWLNVWLVGAVAKEALLRRDYNTPIDLGRDR